MGKGRGGEGKEGEGRGEEGEGRGGFQRYKEGRVSIFSENRYGIKGGEGERNEGGHFYSLFGQLDEWSYCFLR